MEPRMKDESSNKNLERELIRQIFTDKKIIDDISVMINPDVFTDIKHKTVYKIILELNNNGQEIDTVTVYSELTKKGLNEIVKAVDLAKYAFCSSSANYMFTAKFLLEKWMQRKIIQSAKNSIKRAESGDDVFDILATMNSDVYEIENNVIIERDRDLYGELPELLNEIEQKYLGGIPEGLKSSSFPSLNKATGGIMSSDFVVVYGKEKSAKTTWSMRLLLDIALQNIPCALFTLEMDFKSSAYKALSMETGIEYLKLRNPRGNRTQPHELDDFVRKAKKLEKIKIFIDDKTFDFDRIIGKMKILKRKHDIGLFMVDYLGLIESAKRFEARRLEIKHYSRRLKNLAKELNTPIIAVSQANDGEKTAESVDPLRDCDFAIRCCKPYEDGERMLCIGKDSSGNDKFYKYKEDDFLLTVERSRHGKNKQTFMCGYAGTNFVEKDISGKFEDREPF